MQDNLASFYFLVGYTNLLLCDHSEVQLLYKQRKIMRNESVDMFKTALRVSRYKPANSSQNDPDHHPSLFALALTYA